MPKSKRDKKISLTRVEKKGGLERKSDLVDKVRTAVDSYARVFVFQVENMRNIKMKTVRDTWGHSRFFIGKNRVLRKALGNSEEEEYSDNLHQVSTCLRNECGLLMTNQSQQEVVQYFTDLSQPDFARTGGVATDAVVLDEGPLPQFSHSLEPHLRKLGLPTQLKKGVINLLAEYSVCKEGDILSADNAQLLKLLGHQQAEFKLNLVSVWDKEEGKFNLLRSNMTEGTSTGGEEEDSGEEMED